MESEVRWLVRVCAALLLVDNTTNLISAQPIPGRSTTPAVGYDF